jgi:hypothetical protein
VRGPPFSSLIYSSSSSQRSSSLFKLERAFEAIKNNNINYKKTLRKYNFKKPRKDKGVSEQVGSVFISNIKEE